MSPLDSIQVEASTSLLLSSCSGLSAINCRSMLRKGAKVSELPEPSPDCSSVSGVTSSTGTLLKTKAQSHSIVLQHPLSPSCHFVEKLRGQFIFFLHIFSFQCIMLQFEHEKGLKVPKHNVFYTVIVYINKPCFWNSWNASLLVLKVLMYLFHSTKA